MSKEISEEKYVSIEFNTWNNRYKPMEEDNQRLRQQVKELTENNIRVFIYLASDYRSMGPMSSRSVGYLEVKTQFDGNIFSWEDRKKMEVVVNDGVTEAIYNSHSKDWYIGREEAESRIDKMANLIKHYDKIVEANKQHIAGIPKFIKWLFKIKQ
jgi:hypothetical protein